MYVLLPLAKALYTTKTSQMDTLRELRKSWSSSLLGQDQGTEFGHTDDQPDVEAAPKHDWFKKPDKPLTSNHDWNTTKSIDYRPTHTLISNISKAIQPPLIFDELMSTSIDFSAYIMNNLKIDNLTQEILVRPIYHLLEGTCNNFMELEYNFEECHQAVNDLLDWHNPQGHEYPFDLASRCRGSSSRKYTTSTAKTKAAKYDNIEGIEDVVPMIWSPMKRIISVTSVKVMKWYDYGYLEEIEVRREDQKIYKFKEGDFLRLNLRCIKDMLLLLVQKKLSNLDRDDMYDLAMALRMFTKRIVILHRIIYLDKYKRNRLMHSDELYKFYDETLSSVRTVLHDIANNPRMDYLRKRKWSNLDCQRNVITMTIEILLEPTSYKLLVGDLCDSIWIKLVKTGKKRLTITLNRLERSIYIKGSISEGDENTTNPQQVSPTPQALHTLSTIKLPILKKGVDTLNFDDLYNNLRVFESDVKGSTRSFSSTWNVSFVSSNNTSSTNKVNTAYGVSTSSGHNSQKEGSSSYTDELVYSFFANQSSGPQLDHEDLEQVDEFDLEDMDLKWQVAMISTRLKKVYKKTGRKLHFDAKEHVGFDKSKKERCRKYWIQGKGQWKETYKQDEHKAMFTIDGEGVDWTGHAKDDTKDYALMDFNSSYLGLDNEVTFCSKVCEESYAKIKKLYDEQREQLGDASIEIQAYTLALKKAWYGSQIHDEILGYENEVFASVFDSRSSDVEDSPVNDRFAKAEGIHAVPPPMIRNYMPLKSDFGIDESKYTYGPKQSTTSESDA
nr:hypothetical protein [Tanacetum cinerariifolium]